MLPFPGGLYEQEKYNALTWELWNYTISEYYKQKGLKAEKDGLNGN